MTLGNELNQSHHVETNLGISVAGNIVRLTVDPADYSALYDLLHKSGLLPLATEVQAPENSRSLDTFVVPLVDEENAKVYASEIANVINPLTTLLDIVAAADDKTMNP